MLVQHILTAKGNAVATIRPDAPVEEAVEALRVHGVGALVVSVDGSTLDGILSERDVVRRLAVDGPDVLRLPVHALMTAEVTTCGLHDTAESLMRSMTDMRIRHLPVLDEAGALAGIVSIGDVVKGRLAELESENQSLFDYITHPR